MQVNDRLILRADVELYGPGEPSKGRITDEKDERDKSDARYDEEETEPLWYVKFRGKAVTITPLMKDILEMCRIPHTAEEVVQRISENHSCPYEGIYPAVTAFLERMAKFGVVVRDADRIHQTNAVLEQIKKSKKFRDFTLLEEIGSNSKAILYKASLQGDGQNFYTLKIATGERGRKSMRREREILEALPPHANIRKYITASDYRNVPYLVLEYIEGVAMSHIHITEKVVLPAKYDIARQLMRAIGHLHRHGILHGDIHASNFLINANGGVHLIDMGMAYYEHEEKVSHGGVPRYMPPERMPEHSYVFSRQQGDYVAEVFQLGICLYLLFSGYYPFYGRLLRDLRNAIKNDRPPPLTSTARGEPIPESVSAIIFKSLEKDPAERYQSVSDMLQDWAIVMNGKKIKQNLLNGTPHERHRSTVKEQ